MMCEPLDSPFIGQIFKVQQKDMQKWVRLLNAEKDIVADKAPWIIFHDKMHELGPHEELMMVMISSDLKSSSFSGGIYIKDMVASVTQGAVVAP